MKLPNWGFKIQLRFLKNDRQNIETFTYMILYMRSSCTIKSKLLLKDIFQNWYTSYFEPVEIHNVNIEIHSS